MTCLYRMLLKSFFPIFIIALLFFILTLEMVDIFANLIRYLNNDASVSDILLVAWYYVPKSLTFALAPALLFSVSFTMGSLFARNELIAILGSGISLRKFVVPLLLFGILCSLSYFFFHEEVVIETYEKKNSLSRQLLGQRISFSNTNITVLGAENNNVYHADYYNDSAMTLSGLTIVKRDEQGRFLNRIEAEWAEYREDSGWSLHNVNTYLATGNKESDASGELHVEHSFQATMKEESFLLTPLEFQRKVKNIDELPYGEAGEWIDSLRKSGRVGYREALTDYYKRFSFAFTPFIVILLSVSIGSQFKKNILLMSLLVSLGLSVLYYVSDMMLGLFAKQGIIEPAIGAWAAVLIFLSAGVVLLKLSRT